MKRWEEEKVRLGVYKELGAVQAEEEKLIAEHLVHAMYFSAEASKRLNALAENTTDATLKAALNDARLDSLCSMKAIVECAMAAGLTVQLALIDAQSVINAEVAALRLQH